MRITEVLLDLKDGTPIRRREWDEGDYIISRTPEDYCFWYGYISDGAPREDRFSIGPYDLFADDWEIYTGEASK